MGAELARYFKALDRPIKRTSRPVAPHAGAIAMRDCKNCMRAVGDKTRKSHAVLISAPPPKAGYAIEATVINGKRENLDRVSCIRRPNATPATGDSKCSFAVDRSKMGVPGPNHV